MDGIRWRDIGSSRRHSLRHDFCGFLVVTLYYVVETVKIDKLGGTI